RLMQDATPDGTGAMAAVLGLEDAVLQRICDEVSASQVVSCANFNSPGQIVIAGHAEAVERACESARNAGAKRAIVLPVSVPSHCRLMNPAAEGLADALANIDIRPPQSPVFHNVDARPHDNPADIRDSLVAQVREPVLWTATIQLMASMGMTRMAECGPGKVLTGLVRRINRDVSCGALTDDESIRATIEEWSQ
ncbi:MAG: ACP S-malonyltransferase, partial [Xanthomonadales bacterium]|nr:ACP S-malonyltransferase [Xanthomonadales bacterium]